MSLRFNPLLSRRVPTARKKTTLAPELLESRELTTAIPKIAIAPPAEVSILFPVFKPAKRVTIPPKDLPAGILLPALRPTDYTNPCFLPPLHLTPTLGK